MDMTASFVNPFEGPEVSGQRGFLQSDLRTKGIDVIAKDGEYGLDEENYRQSKIGGPFRDWNNRHGQKRVWKTKHPLAGPGHKTPPPRLRRISHYNSSEFI